ncbi:hypothetical protein VM98_34500, partial [Streptomyces rubellomurinus subsp. indigoferus]
MPSATGAVPPLLHALPAPAAPRRGAAGADGDRPLARRLASASAEERADLALRLVRSEAAVVLGHDSAERVRA